MVIFNYEITSIKDASELIGVSRTQIYRLIAEGYLLEINAGGKRMLSTESVTKYKEWKENSKREKQSMKKY